MTALRNLLEQARRIGAASMGSAGVFARDVGQGLLEVSHNTLALLGLLAVATICVGLAGVTCGHVIVDLGWNRAELELTPDVRDIWRAVRFVGPSVRLVGPSARLVEPSIRLVGPGG